MNGFGQPRWPRWGSSWDPSNKQTTNAETNSMIQKWSPLPPKSRTTNKRHPRSFPTRTGHDQHQELHEDRNQNQNQRHPTGVPSDQAQGPGTSHGTPQTGAETRDPPPTASPRPWTRQHPEQEAPRGAPVGTAFRNPCPEPSLGRSGPFFKIRATLKRKP